MGLVGSEFDWLGYQNPLICKCKEGWGLILVVGGGGVQAKVASSILLGAVYGFLRVHSSSLYEQLGSRESGRKGGSQILRGRSILDATVHRLYGS